jgi:hypothetical protein
MTRRGAMWPTELADDDEFRELTPLAQWLFKLLWLHPDLNSGGFLPLQMTAWAKASKHLTPQDLEPAVDELLAWRWLAVDDHAEVVWLCHFIDKDASRKPNIFVAAMRDTEAAHSRTLRREAWGVIDRVYQEQPLKPPGGDADEKAWKAHEDRVRARDNAYEQLRAKVQKEGFGNRSGTVREPPSVGVPVGVGVDTGPADKKLCTRCRRYPIARDGLCGACLGRGLS